MTERTFRDPSPGRPVPSAVDAPPVPTIPHGMQSPVHRRATSMEAPPARITSPTPNGRGASLQPTGSRRNGHRSGVSDIAELTNAERNRGSVNFSYPTDSRPNSPMSMKRLTSPSSSRHNPRITAPNNQSLVYDPNTRSFLPAVQVHAIQQKLYDAANKPVKKKKRDPPGSNTGSHFSDGTVGGRPKGTAVEELESRARQAALPAKELVTQPERDSSSIGKPLSDILADLPPAPLVETALPKKKRKKVVTQDPESDQGSYVLNSSDNDSDAVTYVARKSQQLGKKPSIVREDREREEEEDDTPRPEKSKTLAWHTSPIERNPSPSPLPRSKAGRGHGKDLAVADSPVSEAPVSEAFVAEAATTQIEPSMQHIEPVAESVEQPNGLATNGSIRGARVSSLSPGRNAHFAPTPDNLMVKHQPPARSISPRKSALKHSNSRTSSPMPGSETSNSPGAQEEQIVPRKKSVRVSFDETNVSVGEAAPSLFTDSPVTTSPQAGKRPWYSIGRGKKKEMSATDDEEDEVMKPRPALPFFGSVRERKNRDVEERVLVKMAEPVETKSAFRSPLSTTHTEDAIESPLGQSNDHIVGALFAQDLTTKNAANISKSREPLPPQVTSVEGSGYHSDTDSSTSENGNNTPPTVITEPETVKEPLEPIQTQFPSGSETAPVLQTATSTVDESDDAPTPTQMAVASHIPQIAISEPTPTPEEGEKRKGWPDIPGAWDTSDSESNDTPRVSLDESIAPTPAAAGISEPTPDVQIHASPKVAIEHLSTTPVIMEETESEADVFSDAAEELTSSDEEGFQSLNAVVESPITRSAFMLPNPSTSPTSRLVQETAYVKSGLSESEKPTSHGEGWDKAQDYWSSLSADKKRQIELDAMRAAEEESDTEVEVKPTPKPKKKRKVVKAAVPEREVSNERTYMIQPGSKAAPDGFTPLRSSMRVAPPAPVADVPMKKSMRDPGQGSMRGSMRGSQGNEPRGSMQKKTRPVSLPVEPRVPMVKPVVNHSRNLSSTSPAVAPAPASKPQTPALRRKKSSDSESSFKRSRPSNERGMMMTMRVGNGSAQQQDTASTRLTMRSMSPTESVTRRPFSSSSSQPNDSAQAPMRMSMRGSSGPAPTMRGPSSRAKSPSNNMKMPNFGRSKPVKSQKSSKSLSSRFANSSDEEDERPAFKSRFVDSSDDSDDEPVQKSSSLGRTMRSTPTTAPPVPAVNLRAIPRRTGVEDGDSSDLPDSDDEKPTSPSTAKLSKKRQANGSPILNGNTQGLPDSLRRSGSGRGNITTISSPPVSRPTQKRRGSIMSILRRKKDDTSKVRKSDAESAARRDTPLERSKSDLAALRTPVLGSPKLQKRNPLSRENSNVLPLPPLVAPRALDGEGDDEKRPYSADGLSVGVAIGEKPEAVSRRFTADGPATLNANGNGFNSTPIASNGVVDGAGGKKKKKFASLRRMFRLDD